MEKGVFVTTRKTLVFLAVRKTNAEAKVIFENLAA